MHQTDMAIDEIVRVFGWSCMSPHKQISFRKALNHLAVISRAEDQVPLRCQVEGINAVDKARVDSQVKNK